MVTLARHLDRNRFEPHMALAQAAGPWLAELPHDVVLHDLKASRMRYCLPALLRLIWRLCPKAILSTSIPRECAPAGHASFASARHQDIRARKQHAQCRNCGHGI